MGITGVAVFGRDVTPRRRTQLALRMAKEAAERANQAKSQFLANMSHELRTPLNSVIGFTNILLKNRSGKLTEQELGFLHRITANGQHLLALINEVLDLAKIEAGRMEVSTGPTDLSSLVDETVAQLGGGIKDKKLSLKGEVPPGLHPLTTDSGKLKQVLINLVGNALKFTAEGEVVVTVTTRQDGRTPAALSVRDTGIGIPAERLQAIFEAFQQADGTTSRNSGARASVSPSPVLFASSLDTNWRPRAKWGRAHPSPSSSPKIAPPPGDWRRISWRRLSCPWSPPVPGARIGPVAQGVALMPVVEGSSGSDLPHAGPTRSGRVSRMIRRRWA
jgi:hypothetical protein